MIQAKLQTVKEARDRQLRRSEGMTEAHGHGEDQRCTWMLKRKAYEYWLKKIADIKRRG